jgi:hypothetical protein
LFSGIRGAAGGKDVTEAAIGNDVHAATIEPDRAADVGTIPSHTDCRN